MYSSPESFHSRASRITSHGTLCSRSCLAATGRITSSENLRQYCCHSNCSSVSRKSTRCASCKVVVAGASRGGAPPWLTDQSIHREVYPHVPLTHLHYPHRPCSAPLP